MPETERATTCTALAMFEAVNAIDRRFGTYLGLPHGDANASQEAAAAAAAYTVLLGHYPASKASLDESYAMLSGCTADSASVSRKPGLIIAE